MASQLNTRTSASILVLAALNVLAPGANAQADLKPLPVTSAIDGNGVDLVNWSYAYEVAPISIGPNDQDPIKVNVFLPSERDSFSTNMRIQDPSWVTSARITASVGGKTWSFWGFGGGSEPGSQVETFFGGTSFDYARVRARDGTIINFEIPGWFSSGSVGPVNFCASRIDKPNGEVLTFYNEHDAPLCRTRSVVSNRGYQVKYDYFPNVWNAYRSKITIINNAYEYCDPTAISCSLAMEWPSVTFGGQSGFRAFILHNGDTWAFTSTGLKSPGQSSPGIGWTTQTYYPVNEYPGSMDWRITSATRDGQTWTYSYPSSDPVLGGVMGQLIRVQDPSGSVKRYLRSWALSGGDPSTGEYSYPNIMMKSVDENGHVSTYGYNSEYLPTEVALPEGNKHTATYDGNGDMLTRTIKAKPGSGIADATTMYTYTECCGRPATITDSKGNITEYTYDPVHKGVLTETGPSPTSGAPRPVKRYAYVQRYAWVKSNGGSYVQAASPIWVLDSEKTCRTSATVGNGCTAGISDEVTIAYDYGPNSGPNNLWRRGKVVTADGVSLRTCYSYDPVGNKISETSPRAGLASCS